MKYKLSLLIQILILIAFLFLGNLKIVKAVENPLAKTNNLFGIHILNESDIKDAANLVNSSGGEWGYVTLVIRKDERDTTRWQKVFDELRRHKLIPIVRIATIQQDGGWEKPVLDETDGWVSFLNSLNWVIKNRYVIIGNEPNHAKEWGGEVKPEEYADYLSTLSRKLKEESGDFFVLPAGFDASTPNSDMGMSEATFLQQMVEYKKDIFSNRKLVKDLNKKGTESYALKDANHIVAHLKKNFAQKSQKSTIIVVMTSGDFDDIHQKLIDLIDK